MTTAFEQIQGRGGGDENLEKKGEYTSKLRQPNPRKVDEVMRIKTRDRAIVNKKIERHK